MNDSTQDPKAQGGSTEVTEPGATSAEDTQQGTAGQWPDAVNDPGSGVPGGGRHKYASGKLYCGTEN